MDIFATVLHPIIVTMRYFLDVYQSVCGSWGLSILALSVSVSLLVIPLQRIGRKIEQKIETRTRIVNAEVAKIDSSLKGEQRFNKVEEIYQSHGYHPIQQIWSGSSILILLPVLISAVILFEQHPDLVDSSFLVVSDLSKPDQLVWGFNLLPGVMFLVTLFDAASRFNDNKSGLYRYLVLSIVLVALVYNFPSALLIFWIGSNLVSLIVFRIRVPLSSRKHKTSDRLPDSG